MNSRDERRWVAGTMYSVLAALLLASISKYAGCAKQSNPPATTKPSVSGATPVSPIRSLQFTSDGTTLITLNDNGDVLTYSTNTHLIIQLAKGASAAAILEDDRILIGSKNGDVFTIDAKNNRVLERLSIGRGEILACRQFQSEIMVWQRSDSRRLVAYALRPPLPVAIPQIAWKSDSVGAFGCRSFKDGILVVEKQEQLTYYVARKTENGLRVAPIQSVAKDVYACGIAGTAAILCNGARIWLDGTDIGCPVDGEIAGDQVMHAIWEKSNSNWILALASGTIRKVGRDACKNVWNYPLHLDSPTVIVANKDLLAVGTVSGCVHVLDASTGDIRVLYSK
jgi:outer membrane protein assembly factor BamB